MTSEQQKSDVRDKALKLIEYLLEVASYTRRTVTNVDDDTESIILWFSDVPQTKECYTNKWEDEESQQERNWIVAKHTSEPKPPRVPDICKKWMEKDALYVYDNQEPLPLRSEITVSLPNPNYTEGSEDPKTITVTKHLKDYPDVEDAWDEFVYGDEWIEWTEEHTRWSRAQEVYSKLFRIRQQQSKKGEDYELVLALGLLKWRVGPDDSYVIQSADREQQSSRDIIRHLLVADVAMEFDANAGRFTVESGFEGAKLRIETDFLDTHWLYSVVQSLKDNIDNNKISPSSKSEVEGILKSLVHEMDPNGTYMDVQERQNEKPSATPVVEFAPALILRKRSTRSLVGVLERIKELIENGGTLTPGLMRLVESEPDSADYAEEPYEEYGSHLNNEIYFPKLSNEEQRKIVRAIEHSDGAIVQGPPGTGKSHTIANLICHLLATGRRVLITAKTPRALQVLEGLLPEEMRSLCVNLLEDGQKSQEKLRHSIDGIIDRRTSFRREKTEAECEDIGENISELRSSKAGTENRLRAIRESETHGHTIGNGNYSGTAAKIAVRVNEDRKDYGWFTDSVTEDFSCPYSLDELYNLLKGIREYTFGLRNELSQYLPDSLPPADEFGKFVKAESDAKDAIVTYDHNSDEAIIALLERQSTEHIIEIRDTVSVFKESINHYLHTNDSWVKEAFYDILNRNTQHLRELLQDTQNIAGRIENLLGSGSNVHITYPDTPDTKILLLDAQHLQKHLAGGGKLGWWAIRPAIVKERLYMLEEVKVSNRPCRTAEDFGVFAKVLELQIDAEKVRNLWQEKTPPAEDLEAMLRFFRQRADRLENMLKTEPLLTKARETINSCPGMFEPNWHDIGKIDAIIASCNNALAQIDKKAASSRINDIFSEINAMIDLGNTHEIAYDLRDAVESRNLNTYAILLNEIDSKRAQKLELKSFDERLESFKKRLPKVASDLLNTYNESYWDERIRQFHDAWNWALARYWIEEYVRKEDASALEQKLIQTEDEINRLVAKLASLRAWSFCFDRMTKEHEQHMQSWQDAMRRLGKGTGKYAPRHREDARRHLNECRDAVPAWIMPLHRVWDTVGPAPGIFDVIIVDEASQCGLEGLPLFYLAEKILIVGDDQQISPQSVGRDQERFFEHNETLLSDFTHRDAFHLESSLFSHSIRLYSQQKIILREHFRSMPEIIKFSNDLCYASTPLIPLRQYGPDRLEPLRYEYVPDGYREGNGASVRNVREAQEIVKCIGEISRDKKYDGKTIGVIVLQGNSQIDIIDRQLEKIFGGKSKEFEERKLLCGNPYSFQGGERDIILLSMVAAPNERIGVLSRETYKQSFNVAASRARDQMILFHSVKPEDLSEKCYRSKLLKFFLHTQPQQIAGIDVDELRKRAWEDNRSIVRPPAPFDSWFEVDVALEILGRGYKVVPQYEVASKRIDLVVEGGNARLAVECDGDYWHGPDKYDEDVERERMLGRSGWEFFRVRQSTFYHDKEKALERLWPKLEERGIYPLTASGLHRPPDNGIEEYEPVDEDFDEDNGDVDIPEDTDELEEEDTRTEETELHITEQVEDIDIQRAIVSALSECANHTCTVKSTPAKVLKELGIITRGKPRQRFARRVMKNIDILAQRGTIEKYKATNDRIRLVENDRRRRLFNE